MIDIIQKVSQELEMPDKQLFSDSLRKIEGEVSIALHLDIREVACCLFFTQSCALRWG